MLRSIKNKDFLIIFIISLFVLTFFTFIYSSLVDYLYIYQKKEIYAKIIVGENYGVALNNSSLIFGMVPPGGSSSKEVEILNSYTSDVRFQVYSTGFIKKFLFVSDSDFVLKPNETKNLSFTVKIPFNSKFGVYEGKVIIVIDNLKIK